MWQKRGPNPPYCGETRDSAEFDGYTPSNHVEPTGEPDSRNTVDGGYTEAVMRLHSPS